MRSLIFIVIAMCLPSLGEAAQITITFSGLNSFVSSYTEQGFTFTGNVGPSPGANLFLGGAFPPISVVPVVSGTQFDLVSVDIVGGNGSAVFDNAGFGGGCGAGFSTTGAPYTGSFSGSGCTGITGFRVFAPAFQNSTIDNLVINVVPEPATSSLLALGLIALGLSRRRIDGAAVALN